MILSVIETFEISRHEINAFSYLGLKVVQTSDTVVVDQDSYIDSLEPIVIDPARKKQINEPLTAEEKKSLKALSGKLLWVTSQTRPDVAYLSCLVSNNGTAPTVRSLIDANKAVSRLKRDRLKLKFPDLGNPELIDVHIYGDASYGSLPSGASQGAYIAFLRGNGKIAPISWKSKRLDRVAKSPLAAEAMAMADAADAGYFLVKMTKEIFGLQTVPNVTCYTDSKSLMDHLESNKLITDLRMRVDVARLREMIELREIHMIWVDTENQLADALTKAGASSARLVEVLEKSSFI